MARAMGTRTTLPLCEDDNDEADERSSPERFSEPFQADGSGNRQWCHASASITHQPASERSQCQGGGLGTERQSLVRTVFESAVNLRRKILVNSALSRGPTSVP